MPSMYCNDFPRPCSKGPMVIYLDDFTLRKVEYSTFCGLLGTESEWTLISRDPHYHHGPPDRVGVYMPGNN